VLIPSAADIFY